MFRKLLKQQRVPLPALPTCLSAVLPVLARNCWFFGLKDCVIYVSALLGEQMHNFHFLLALLQKNSFTEAPMIN